MIQEDMILRSCGESWMMDDGGVVWSQIDGVDKTT